MPASAKTSAAARANSGERNRGSWPTTMRPRSPAAAVGGVPARRRRRDAPDLGERAVVGDDAAPPVGAEGDRQRAGARGRQARGTPRACASS